MRNTHTVARLSEVDTTISSWGSRPRRIVHDLISRYDMPHEAAGGVVTWYYNSPWKRTVVYREGVPHNFPHRHIDHIKQTVVLRVPPNKSGDLLLFNGSIIVDRTRGELSARCSSEAMNILLLNLAYDVIRGATTVKEARASCVHVSRMLAMHWPEPYTQKLNFSSYTNAVESEYTAADPDHAASMLF